MRWRAVNTQKKDHGLRVVRAPMILDWDGLSLLTSIVTRSHEAQKGRTGRGTATFGEDRDAGWSFAQRQFVRSQARGEGGDEAAIAQSDSSRHPIHRNLSLLQHTQCHKWQTPPGGV